VIQLLDNSAHALLGDVRNGREVALATGTLRKLHQDELAQSASTGVALALSRRREHAPEVVACGCAAASICGESTCTSKRPSLSDAGCKPSVLGGAPREPTCS